MEQNILKKSFTFIWTRGFGFRIQGADNWTIERAHIQEKLMFCWLPLLMRFWSRPTFVCLVIYSLNASFSFNGFLHNRYGQL